MSADDKRLDQTRLVNPVPGGARANSDDIPTSFKLNNIVAKLTIVDGTIGAVRWKVKPLPSAE